MKYLNLIINKAPAGKLNSAKYHKILLIEPSKMIIVIVL